MKRGDGKLFSFAWMILNHGQETIHLSILSRKDNKRDGKKKNHSSKYEQLESVFAGSNFTS
ncbi:hypothetical protein OIU79_000969 [Salix purpurea]|uniref:Uncharacterized protein n=1 Tax=Salix purpurea TaxID=77065 RepID=A0A9Q0ZNH7_SALPP|nr:hypothetical protein OIU79_000969 [Salix purpurea]